MFTIAFTFCIEVVIGFVTDVSTVCFTANNDIAVDVLYDDVVFVFHFFACSWYCYIRYNQIFKVMCRFGRFGRSDDSAL